MLLIDLNAWVEANRERLRPPVGNALIFDAEGFIVMAVGGPNARQDFHVNEGPELFLQLEGDIVLRVIEGEGADLRVTEVPIREGQLFLLPPRVPHSPQRPANTVGLVVERVRTPDERDGFLWLCESCGAQIHRTEVHLHDITAQLAELLRAFWADTQARTCPSCGALLERRDGRATA